MKDLILKKDFKIKKIVIRSEFKDLRLDIFLNKKSLVQSRSQGLNLISQNCVFINNNICKKASYCLKTGDSVKVLIPLKKEKTLRPYNFPLKIHFEDKHVVIVNKPAGLVVHPAPGHEDKTLVNILAHKIQLSPGSQPFRPGVVHRLDKNVSGLLLLTKTQIAQDHLIQQFKNHQVKRIYWAVCLRSPSPIEGKIESWIARHPIHRKKFRSLKTFQKGSKKAISSYNLLHRHNSGLCWIKCHLQTGRTHQIRVHLSSLACPIAGDTVYGGQNKLAFIKDPHLKKQVKNLNRIALHAHRLSFLHPVSGKQMAFQSSWPSDLKSLLEVLDFLKK